MSWLGSVFTGSNPTLSAAIPQYGNISQFGVNTGEGDINQANSFWGSILSGDSSKIGQVLGPQISNIQQQGQQEKQQLGQFGNRSGGNNSKAQTVGDSTRSNVNNMVSSLTGSAASNLGSMGQNLLGQGTAALGQQVNASQTQMSNWSNSLFGQASGAITGALTGAVTGGLGLIPGLSNVI